MRSFHPLGGSKDVRSSLSSGLAYAGDSFPIEPPDTRMTAISPQYEYILFDNPNNCIRRSFCTFTISPFYQYLICMTFCGPQIVTTGTGEIEITSPQLSYFYRHPASAKVLKAYCAA